MSPRPAGLLVRVALRQAAPVRAVRRAIRAALDRVGVAAETLIVEAADEIRRAGTGAKEKLVSVSD